MSKIKEQYLWFFYDDSEESCIHAIKICHTARDNNQCDMKCSSCPLQNIKALFNEIHRVCRDALLE